MEKIRANIPEKYLENRDTIEGRLILAFWKQPELLDEYKLNPKDDLVNEDSRLLYNLAVKMYESGIIEFDLVSVETYLEKYPQLLAEINENGGVKELIRSANTINTVNIENYYDDLLKANYLIDLYFTQKQLVSDFDKMKNMTDSLCVADYVEHLVGECASSKIMKKVEVNELYISDQLLDEIIQGELIETISFGEYAPKLNDILYGCPLSMVTMISAPSGCVDCETEFFNGSQWKKISDYQPGDKVLQYNTDGTANLVYPLDYIKKPEEKMYHFKSKYGLDQCLSAEHDVVLHSKYYGLHKMPMHELVEKHNRLKYGIEQTFLTTFDYVGSGISYTDDEIRLMCAVVCDGSFKTDGKTNWCRVNLKKPHKKERIKMLLNNCGIEYKERDKDNGYTVFKFYAPIRMKTFAPDWYNCTKEQFRIIVDEIIKWDGHVGKRKSGKESWRFSTTDKENADFVQFALSSIGYRSTIAILDRVGQPYFTNGKQYIRKSVEYTVSRTKRIRCGIGGNTKVPIVECKPKDGFKYCFTVPSGMLVLRRNNKIFITGNSGKSTFITSMMLYPFIKQGEIVTLISNELGYKQYLIMLITMVLTRELDYYKITRDKILKAKLTAEDIEKLKEAQAFINNNYKGGIKFINYNSSDIDIVIRNMKKYARLGSRVVVYDTMKSPNSANERAWADIIEASKLLTYTCQETNQALILSYQIAMHASTKRFLTGTDLSQGKQIKEMITNHIIFRYLKPDEYSGERYDVKPYRWKREETSGKTYKEYFKTDPDKRYIVVYVEKTRNGEDGKHLLYRFDGHHATYTELGYCTVVPD